MTGRREDDRQFDSRNGAENGDLRRTDGGESDRKRLKFETLERLEKQCVTEDRRKQSWEEKMAI